MASITRSADAHTILAGYTVRNLVFESETIRIYRALRDEDGLPVILKLPRDGQYTREAMRSVQHEYAILQHLQSTRTARVHALKWQEGLPVIVMADHGGESLQQVLEQADLALEESLKIAVEIAAALAEIHASNTVHKDINPSNVIYNSRTGDVRIIDFGNASYLRREQVHAVPPQAVPGTVEYIAPEQTGRMNRSVDFRTDLYSFGATLYKILSGKLLFDADEPIEWFHCHIARQPKPLAQVDATIPVAVSAIVMKLLEKNAEDRYQTARGVWFDLQHCLQQLREHGRVQSFPLAKHDVSDRFQIPNRLYGRHQERDALLQALDDACLGDARLILISGPPGVGKNRLIQELQEPMAAQRGYLVKGRFEHAHRAIPYSAVKEALDGLVRQLLTESDLSLQAWKEKIMHALGSNVGLIIQLVSTLELIVGPQPSPPPLPPVESERRFMLALLKFVQLVGHKDHPLAVVLHELQWADKGSLRLLNMLLSAVESSHLLIVGTYNDQAVSSSSALDAMQDRFRAHGARVLDIKLRPLQHQDIEALLADTLQTAIERVSPLAKVVEQKTAGNPLAVELFLGAQRQQGLIAFNPTQGKWEWQLEQISNQQITDNVVELMADRLQALAEPASRLLQLAACIGGRFSQSLLATLATRDPYALTESLQEAVLEGLILPVTGGTQPLGQAGLATEVQFDFAHDRIRQAAYLLLGETERLAVHQRLGQLLLAQSTAAEQEERLFEILHHLNLAADLIDDPEERVQLCRLNLAAGKRAKNAASYPAAFGYFDKALSLITAGGWCRHYDLMLELHVQTAETAYLTGRHDALDALLEAGLRETRDILDQVALYQVRIAALIARGELLQAVELAKPILAELGHRYPAKPTRLHIFIRMLTLKLRLRGKSMADLRRLPAMTDQKHLAAMRIGESIGSAAMFAQPLLLPLMIMHAVDVSLTHGHSPQSHSTYAGFGMILAGVLGQVNRGYDFGRLALALRQQSGVPRYPGRTLHVFSSLVQHWKEPLRETLEPLKEARQQCLESGDFEYAIHAASVYVSNALAAGRDLQHLREEVSELLRSYRALGQGPLLHHLACYQQYILCLLGESENSARLVGEAYDIDQQLPQLEQATDQASLYTARFTQMLLDYLFGQYEQALAQARRARALQAAVQGFYATATYLFIDSLSCLGVIAESKTPNFRRRLLRRAASNQRRLKRLAKQNPANFLNKYLLVQAERLRVQGRDFAAHTKYDHSIALAQQEGVLHEQAIANELCGSMHLRAGRLTIAEPYLWRAHELFHRWGAVAKVEDLERRYPQVFVQPQLKGTGSAGTTVFDDVNLTSLMKALRVIASEQVHSRMVAVIIRTAIEFAGAQYGLLALRNAQGELCIEAEAEVDVAEIKLLQSLPLAQHADVSQAIVNYVARTHESLVVNDALADAAGIPGLSQDAHVRRRQVRSILCLPILAGAADRAELIGILYLENNRASGSFTRERFGMLEIICIAAAGRLELSRKAAVDGLTNLFNHDYFQNMLRQEVAAASRYRRELALIMLDIDHFKRFNDTWGHQLGDQVLREVAELIQAGSREEDTVARYGGEEIAVILPGARADEARQVGERLRQSVEAHVLEVAADKTAQVTVSVGLASLGPAAPDAVSLIQKADAALYRSKAEGRNRLTVA